MYSIDEREEEVAEPSTVKSDSAEQCLSNAHGVALSYS